MRKFSLGILCLFFLVIALGCQKKDIGENPPTPMEVPGTLVSTEEMQRAKKESNPEVDAENVILMQIIDRELAEKSESLTEMYQIPTYVAKVDEMNLRIRDVENWTKEAPKNKISLRMDVVDAFDLMGFVGEDGTEYKVEKEGDYFWVSKNLDKDLAPGTDDSMIGSVLKTAIYKNVSHPDFEKRALLIAPVPAFFITDPVEE